MKIVIDSPMDVTKPIGTLHPKGTEFVRIRVGSMSTDGLLFELSTPSPGLPLVLCFKTKRYFSLNWEQICELAIEAGLGKDGL
jgi:hypothetical protein